jgi:hypothetical protein
MAADLATLGIQSPADLAGRSAFEMYAQLCDVNGMQHDQCVIDVFMSVIDYMAGNEAKPGLSRHPRDYPTIQTPMFVLP